MRIAFLVLLGTAACSSYGEEAPRGPDGGTAADATAEGGASSCAAKKCIRFDQASEAILPFGFERSNVGAGTSVSIVPSGLSAPNALRVVSNDDAEAWVELRILERASTIRVRANVRSGALTPGNSTSTHIIDVFCTGGDRMDVKIGPARELDVQISSPSSNVGHLTDGTWVPIDFVLQFGGGTIAKLTRLDTGEANQMNGSRSCSPPFTVHVGATNFGPEPVDASYEVWFDDVEVDWN